MHAAVKPVAFPSAVHFGKAVLVGDGVHAKADKSGHAADDARAKVDIRAVSGIAGGSCTKVVLRRARMLALFVSRLVITSRCFEVTILLAGVYLDSMGRSE